MPLKKTVPACRSRVLARLGSPREDQMASAEHQARTHLTESQGTPGQIGCVRRQSDCPTGAAGAALRVRAAGSRSRQLVLRQQHRAQQRTRSGHDYVRERVRFT